MKIKKVHLLVLLALAALPPTLSTAHAQGTAFTYQGQLQYNGSPANGHYDFTFALFNNSSTNTGQVGGTLTDTNVGVTNGLFTVTLDFGSVFTGNATWLAIGVRTNGGGSFTTLNPLQPLTPTPYAIYAPNAGAAASANSVAVSNIVGTIAAGQLPTAVVTNGESGVNFTGTFTGNGAGINALGIANSLQATNLLAVTYPSFPPTTIINGGESIDWGAASQYPAIAWNNPSNQLAGMYAQWAASMGIVSSNFAINGINSFRAQTDGGAGYASPGGIYIRSNQIVCVPGMINDLAQAILPDGITLRDDILLQWIQPVLLANETLGCWVSADRHPLGSDILSGGNHYGYTNGTGPWRTSYYTPAGQPGTFWYPFMSGAILSTNVGDKITFTNVVGPCVLLYDEWQSNAIAFGGTMAVSVDGSAFTNVNCTMSNFVFSGYGSSYGATNNIAGKLFNLAPGIHTIIMSNAGGNIGFECLLDRGHQTATNAVFVRNIYNTPYSTIGGSGFGFTNQLTNVLIYNQLLLNNVLALDSIGLPVKYVDVFSVMNNSTNYYSPADYTHASLLGYIAMAAEFDYVATGNPGHFAAFLASGGIINPFQVAPFYNGSPNFTGTVQAGALTVANGITVSFTNTAPTGVTWGTTPPDTWFPITYNGTNYMVPGFKNH